MKRTGWALLVMTTGANFSAPVFPIYQHQYHLSALMVTFLFAIYAICLIPCMVIAGTSAKRYGPKRLTLLGVTSAMAATGLFLWNHHAWNLFLARALEGAALGLFMGPGTALFINQTSGTSRNRMVTSASIMTMVGFGLGPLITSFALWIVSTRQVIIPYIFLLMMLLSAWGALVTLPSRTPTLSPEHSPRRRISSVARTEFWRLYAPMGFTLFALNGTAIALIPSDVGMVFHSANPLWTGLLLFVVLGGGGMAQLSLWPEEPRHRLRWGMGSLLVGTWLMISASFWKVPGLLIGGMIFQALGGGWTFRAALYGVTRLTDSTATATIVSWFYIAAYVGMIIPVLFTGWVTDLWGLPKALGVLGLFMTFGGFVPLYKFKSPSLSSTLTDKL